MIETIGIQKYIYNVYTRTVTCLSILKAGNTYIYKLLVKESEYKSKISKILRSREESKNYTIVLLSYGCLKLKDYKVIA